MDMQEELTKVFTVIVVLRRLDQRSRHNALVALTLMRAIDSLLYYKYRAALCPLHGIENIR